MFAKGTFVDVSDMILRASMSALRTEHPNALVMVLNSVASASASAPPWSQRTTKMSIPWYKSGSKYRTSDTKSAFTCVVISTVLGM